MASYNDSLDIDEFILFRKFNNGYERKGRHIDCYYIKSEEETDKIEYNLTNLIKDTKAQIASMENYFKKDNPFCELGDFYDK